MRYLIVAIVSFGLGISCELYRAKRTINQSSAIAETNSTAAPKKLPKEVQEQFDAYLLTSPILETVVVRIIKNVLEALLVTSLIALVTDYPFQVIGAYVLSILLVSYPVTRYLISRYAIRARASGQTEPVLPS